MLRRTTNYLTGSSKIDGFSSGSSRTNSPNRSERSDKGYRSTRSQESDHLLDEDQSELLESFRQFDEDGDGEITREELGKALRLLDEGYWSWDRIDALMLAADRDGDGSIQYSEFVLWVTGKSAARRVAVDLGTTMERLDPQEAVAYLDADTEYAISQAFFKFDTNQDGIITREELAVVMQSLDAEEWSDDKVGLLLQYADANGDQCIQYKEFCAWLLGQQPARQLAGALTGETITLGLGAPTHAKIAEAFKNFDEDGDGIISAEELRKVLYRLDPFSWNDRKVDALLRAADTNGDGNIQYEEFVEWVLNGSPESKEIAARRTPPALTLPRQPDEPCPVLDPYPGTDRGRPDGPITLSIVKMNGQHLMSLTLPRNDSVRTLRAAASEALGGQPCRLVAGTNYLGHRLTLGEVGLYDGAAVTAVVSAGILQVAFTAQGGYAALKADGSVVTWGGSHAGGDSSQVAELLREGVDHVFSTWFAFAALRVDGSVVCWGHPGSGGNSSRVADDLSEGVVQIVSTRDAFAARKVDGTVAVWGNLVSRSHIGLYNVTAIYSNRLSFAAVHESGAVSAWGDPACGGELNAEIAQLLEKDVARVFSTCSAFAALMVDGSVVAWGDPSMGGDVTPVASQLTSGVKEVYATHCSFAALKADGSVVMWGHPDAGGCCSHDVAAQLNCVEQIYSTDTAFAALKVGGSVVCWGLEGGSMSAETAEELSQDVVSVCPSGAAFAALKSSGAVVAWGNASAGGSCEHVAHLVGSNVDRIYATEGAFAALIQGGSLVVWGSEVHGGDSSTVEDMLREGVAHVFTTRQAFAALKIDNSVVAWGAGVELSALAKLQPCYAPVSAG